MPCSRRDAGLLLPLQILEMCEFVDLQDIIGDDDAVRFGGSPHQPSAIVVIGLGQMTRRLEVDVFRKRCSRVASIDHSIEFARFGFRAAFVVIRTTITLGGSIHLILQDAN